MLVAETPLHKQGYTNQSFTGAVAESPPTTEVVEETPAKVTVNNTSSAEIKPDISNKG